MALVCFGLAAITFAVFGQTAGFRFINYDDKSYIYDNPVVKQGLTWHGAGWALTYGKIGHWHPLTWISHMADCQVYGLWAGGHHLSSVILHALGAALLFLALKELTGILWRSAFAAAVFAIHPLRVESVAWIAERKDVLSGVFFMLTLLAYARYARRQRRVDVARGRRCFWVGPFMQKHAGDASVCAAVAGLVAAPSADAGQFLAAGQGEDSVLPALRRFVRGHSPCARKVVDKLPVAERLACAVVSYAVYLRQMFFPTGLAIPYVYPPSGLPIWETSVVICLLAGITVAAVAFRKERPYLLVGWLWYLGMLLPAIGLIQISYYWHADRYTYLPGIGIAIAVTWAVADLSLRWKHRQALGSLMAVVIGVLMVCSCIQTTYWADSETLWKHSLACTMGNYIAELDLGNVYDRQGNKDDAMAHFQAALKINPKDSEAHNNLGNDLREEGQLDEAISQYHQAIQSDLDNPEPHYNLGIALGKMGQPAQEIAQYEEALRINPDHTGALVNLGAALMSAGRFDDAISHFQKALKIDPSLVQAYNDLGNAFLQKGDLSEAIKQFQFAAQMAPSDPWVKNNLAWMLATCPDASFRDGSRAVDIAAQANDLTGGENPLILHTLAAALAEAGRFPEAVETAQRALSLANSQGATTLAADLQSELKLYQARRCILLHQYTNRTRNDPNERTEFFYHWRGQGRHNFVEFIAGVASPGSHRQRQGAAFLFLRPELQLRLGTIHGAVQSLPGPESHRRRVHFLFPHSLSSPDAWTRMHQHVPDARIIYMVRHPLKRMESAYVEHLCTAVSHVFASVNDAVKRQPMIVDSSRYWEVFDAYRQKFDESKIKIVWFEEYTANTVAVFQDVCRFLEIDDTVVPDIEQRTHQQPRRRLRPPGQDSDGATCR